MDPTVPSLVAALRQVPDPRHARGRRYPWTALLLLIVAALLSAANTQRAIARWGRDTDVRYRRALGFTRAAAPSEPTLRRLFQQVDVAVLERVLGTWQQQVRAAWRQATVRWLDGIAIDGKTLRGARRLGGRDVQLVSACCQRSSRVLGQQVVPAATTALAALPAFLAQVALRGETLTFDAEFTHAWVADQVVRGGGAYRLVVKANQPTLLAACLEATAPAPIRPARRLGQTHTVALRHGRLEERELWAVEAPPDLGLPYARQVLRLHRRRCAKDTGALLSDETVYAVTSLGPETASARQLLGLWQRHWWIENKVHWVRDVVFGEDRSTTRTGTAPQALAAFRNLVIGLLHGWHRADITAARQYFASHPAALFRRLGLSARRL